MPQGVVFSLSFQVIELLAEHLSHWSCSIAFPELAHLPLLHLRKFGKQCKVERFRTSSRALADALERNMAFVSQRRQQVDFSPKDTAQVNTFLQTELAANQVRRCPDPALLAHVIAFARSFCSTFQLKVGLSSCTCNVICKQQQLLGSKCYSLCFATMMCMYDADSELLVLCSCAGPFAEVCSGAEGEGCAAASHAEL